MLDLKYTNKYEDNIKYSFYECKDFAFLYSMLLDIIVGWYIQLS